MMIVTYEIDSGGDIELVLNDPNSQQIVPIIKYQYPGDYYNALFDGDSDNVFDNPPLSGRYAIFNIDKSDALKEVATKEEGDAKEDTAEEIAGETATATASSGSDQVTEIRMRVSSRHLILASRTFRAMLEGPWSENSSPAPESGPRQIKTSDWDAAALAIVLDAIHGRHMEIPKDINLGLLVRIATIVDYYDATKAFTLSATYGWPVFVRHARYPLTIIASPAFCGCTSHGSFRNKMFPLPYR
jgi:hypothetical protein